jgi:hypothetical protein
MRCLTVSALPVPFQAVRAACVWLACVLGSACAIRSPDPPTGRSVPPDAFFTVVASSIVTPVVEPSARRYGGISGVAYDSGRSEWIAVSDDHVSPRWFVSRVAVSDSRVEIQNRRLVPAKIPVDEQGEPRFADFEAVTILAGGDLLISSEGGVESNRRHPASLLRFRRDGSYSGEVPLPSKFLPFPLGAPQRGLRDNRGFEGLALSRDGSRLWAIAEAPLWQDDDLPDAQRTGRSRLLEFEVRADAFTAARELVYVIDQAVVPPGLSPDSQVVDQGVSDMTVLPDGTIVTMERAFVRDSRSRRTVNLIRLFRIQLDGADDVSALATLRDAPQATPVRKDLLLDLGSVSAALAPRLSRLENFEAMAPGPPLPAGQSLLILSDNNFNATQVTAAVVLRY